MSESFFRNTLGARARAARRVVADEGKTHSSGGRGGADGKEIYDDVSVCRALGVRRRVLAAARTLAGRGADWDALDEHAGMTRGWIGRKSAEMNVTVDFGSLRRIESGDGVVSVRLIGFHTNPCVCIVEVVATQKRGFARVRNIFDYPIYPGECFDCRRIGGNLEWVANLNEVKY